MNDPGNLPQIRLQLRGPIADSPFAGRNKKDKIDYCKRQMRLLSKWYRQTGCPDFAIQVLVWANKIVSIRAGKL